MQPMNRTPRFLLLGAIVACVAVLAASPAMAQVGLGSVQTDAQGRFSTTFVFPPSRAGEFDVVAVGCEKVSDPYPPGANASIAVSPNIIPEFESRVVTVIGAGWSPNTTVDLSLDRVSFFNLAQVTCREVTRRARILVIGERDCPDCDRDRDCRDCVIPVNPTGGGTTIINNVSSSSSSSAAAGGGGGGGGGFPGGGGALLVRTGVEVLPLLLAGLGAIMLGSVLLAASRRRRHASS